MKSVKRTDWGRRTPPIGGSSFELYAWFFMRISGLFLVLLAAGHMFIMHVFNDTLNLDYEFVAARWDTPFWRIFCRIDKSIYSKYCLLPKYGLKADAI